MAKQCSKLRGMIMIGINEIFWGMMLGMLLIGIDKYLIPGGVY